jgi:hypothetical protein
MSYGTVLADAFSQAGAYTGRILKGKKPNDIPAARPWVYAEAGWKGYSDWLGNGRC